MANKDKAPKMGRGLASLAKKDKKKNLGEKQYDTYVAELDSNFDKMNRVQKMYKGASPKIKADLKNKFKKFSDSFGGSQMINAADRDTGKTEYAKGGRAGYKKGKSVKKKSSGKAIRGKGCEIR